MYVDGFANILSNRDAETELLKYAQANKIDTLLLYDLHRILNKRNAADRRHNTALARFLARSKTEYGIRSIAAVGEHAGFFANVIDPYNNSRGDAKEKFDIYNLEFEFWIKSRIKDVYFRPYLKPNGLPANEDGAFQFFLESLKRMRSLAQTSSHKIQTEAYIGWTNKLTEMTAPDVEREIAMHVDRIRVHAYRSKPDFAYTSQRLNGLVRARPSLPISVIFSTEKAFMHDWLSDRSMQAAETDFMKQLRENAPRALRSTIRLEGFTYYSWQHPKRSDR